jgi:hypothetical protein
VDMGTYVQLHGRSALFKDLEKHYDGAAS